MTISRPTNPAPKRSAPEPAASIMVFTGSLLVVTLIAVLRGPGSILWLTSAVFAAGCVLWLRSAFGGRLHQSHLQKTLDAAEATAARFGIPVQPAEDPLDSEHKARARADRAVALLDASVEQAEADAARAQGTLRDLASVLDAVDEPVFVIGPDDLVRLCNDAAVAMFAGEHENRRIAGRAIDEVFTSTEVHELCARARDGQTHRRQLRLRSESTTSAFDATAAPVTTAAGREIVLTLKDVTELARSVEVKTDFVANASHELRTPIAAISAAAETLEDVSDDPKISERLVGVIRVHAERLGEMVSDLLDLSRVESGQIETRIELLDAEAAIAAACAAFDERCREHGIEIDVKRDPTIRTLKTDPKLFGLILRNLLDNATKFSPHGENVRVNFFAEGSDLRFTVADRGVGIPIDQQPRIFERFYQVDPARVGGGKRGTGLGLAIVKHACLALGGDVTLESVWQRGSTFTVKLPGAITGEQDAH